MPINSPVNRFIMREDSFIDITHRHMAAKFLAAGGIIFWSKNLAKIFFWELSTAGVGDVQNNENLIHIFA